MIYGFKDLEVRKSGIVYNSTFEQIKKLYAVDPEQAGELAIAAIELVLTGDISSDDVMVNLCLEPLRVVRDNDEDKWQKKVDATKQKKIEKDKLDMIAEMYLQGLKQKQIGERLGLSQQLVSYRLNIIKANYPELLQKNLTEYKNTNSTKDEVFVKEQSTKNTKDTKNEVLCNFVKEDSYKNTKDTNFVQICTENSFVLSDEDSEPPEIKPGFVF